MASFLTRPSLVTRVLFPLSSESAKTLVIEQLMSFDYVSRRSAVIFHSRPWMVCPFRVFIVNEKTIKDLMIPKCPIVLAAEKGLWETPHMVFYSNKTGYMSICQFRLIMEDFINWWTSTNEGVDGLLIRDKLSVHKNLAVVKIARERCDHMLNIKSGSSHWFQVRDHNPFSILKKKTDGRFSPCFFFKQILIVRLTWRYAWQKKLKQRGLY